MKAVRDDEEPAGEARGSLGQEAYARLREAIDAGKLVPGQPIREQELSSILGMSRTPVRAAISSLEAHGLVTIDPKLGRVITRLDYQSIIELYSFRETLEGYAARLAAQHASDAEVAALRAMVKREAELVPDIPAIVRHNRRFHQAIHFAAKNRYLTRAIEAVQGSMSLVGPTTDTDEDMLRATIAEHAAIVEAVGNRDPNAAEGAMRAHIQATQRARIRMMINAGDD